MALVKCHECGSEVSTQAKTCPKCGAKVKKKRMGNVGRLIVMVILGAVLVGVLSESLKHGGTGSTAGSSTTSKPKEPTTADRLEFKLVAWRKGGFDNVMLLSFSVKNSNPYAIKDMMVGCDLFAPSGTRVASVVRVVHEKVDAGKTRQFNSVNMGLIHSESTTASCSIGIAHKA